MCRQDRRSPCAIAPKPTAQQRQRGVKWRRVNRQVTAYASPDADGPDSQFWAVLTLEFDPDVVVLVATTDQYPGFVGTWFDGLYFIEGAQIIPVS